MNVHHDSREKTIIKTRNLYTNQEEVRSNLLECKAPEMKQLYVMTGSGSGLQVAL